MCLKSCQVKPWICVHVCLLKPVSKKLSIWTGTATSRGWNCLSHFPVLRWPDLGGLLTQGQPTHSSYAWPGSRIWNVSVYIGTETKAISRKSSFRKVMTASLKEQKSRRKEQRVMKSGGSYERERGSIWERQRNRVAWAPADFPAPVFLESLLSLPHKLTFIRFLLLLEIIRFSFL